MQYGVQYLPLIYCIQGNRILQNIGMSIRIYGITSPKTVILQPLQLIIYIFLGYLMHINNCKTSSKIREDEEETYEGQMTKCSVEAFSDFLLTFM
jgi:hypothetical protein